MRLAYFIIARLAYDFIKTDKDGGFAACDSSSFLEHLDDICTAPTYVGTDFDANICVAVMSEYNHDCG